MANEQGGFTTITEFEKAIAGNHRESWAGPVRDGYKMMPIKIRLRGAITIQDVGDPPTPQQAYVRLILLRCKTSAVPTLNQVLDFGIAGISSFQVPYNRTYANQWFKILVDKRYNVDRDHRQTVLNWSFKRGMRPITYTSDLPTSASKGQLVFYWMSNIGQLLAGQPIISYYWTVTAVNM